MAQITVRQFDDNAHAALKRRAARNHRSLEGEVRSVLEAAAREDIRREFLSWTDALRARIAPDYTGDVTADIRADRDSR